MVLSLGHLVITWLLLVIWSVALVLTLIILVKILMLAGDVYCSFFGLGCFYVEDEIGRDSFPESVCVESIVENWRSHILVISRIWTTTVSAPTAHSCPQHRALHTPVHTYTNMTCYIHSYIYIYTFYIYIYHIIYIYILIIYIYMGMG